MVSLLGTRIKALWQNQKSCSRMNELKVGVSLKPPERATGTWLSGDGCRAQLPANDERLGLSRQIAHRSKVFNTLPGPLKFHFHCLFEIFMERRPLLNDHISLSGIRQESLEYLRKWKHPYQLVFHEMRSPSRYSRRSTVNSLR